VRDLAEPHRAWLRQWAAGHRSAALKRYTDAVDQFTDLKDAGPANTHVLVHLADWQVWLPPRSPSLSFSFSSLGLGDCGGEMGALEGRGGCGVSRAREEAGGFLGSIEEEASAMFTKHSLPAQERTCRYAFCALHETDRAVLWLSCLAPVLQWKQGNLPAGRQAFEIAFRADPNNLERMDVFAHVLVCQGKESELNALCTKLLQVCQTCVLMHHTHRTHMHPRAHTYTYARFPAGWLQ
jgi:hypothetical protein